ncbi:MAG: hypothetical protein M1115_02260 [Actinobacteria bacterium]|nr:hypothetical protein [Actinomycetota bacterium]
MIVAIVIMVILVGKVDHTGTTPHRQTIVSMPHVTLPPTAPSSPPISTTTPPAMPTLGSGIEDNFTTIRSLSPSEWVTSSPMMSSMARIGNEVFVGPALGFSSAGMSMAGATGPEQFTGIQSVKIFALPLTVTAWVTGDVSSGNPFGLFLMNQQMTHYVDVAGNLNPANGAYGIRLDTQNGPSGYLGSDVLVAAPRVGVAYLLSITVSSSGIAQVEVENASGTVLGSTKDITVGSGPFYALLAQWEGTPTTEGPNRATWSSLSLHHS